MRQWDPIYPYLFTLVMEMFTLIMKKRIILNLDFRHNFGCKKLKITHLCFVDDLIVLCNGDATSVQVIKQALKEFGGMSGLKPHLNKSIAFFGGSPNEEQNHIMRNSSFCCWKVTYKVSW